MDPLDTKMTTFRTPMGNFHYTIMSFSLKNVGSFYQCAMTAIFHDMVRDYLEDYVDNIVVKPMEEHHQTTALREVFTRCRQYKFVDALKCAFGISSEKFSGFTIHRKKNRPRSCQS